MKKTFILFIVLSCCLSIFANKRYLVQTGEDSDVKWRSVNVSKEEVLVDLKSLGQDVGTWFNSLDDIALADSTEIWVAAGTYRTTALKIKSNYFIYGGFKGIELAPDEREKGEMPWAFTNETVLDANYGKGIFLGGGSRSRVFLDGFTLCNSVDESAVKLRGAEAIRNCIIQDNVQTSTASKGGGVLLYQGGNIYSCLFRRNESASGGGLALVNTTVNATRCVVEKCVFEENNAVNGSAIYLEGAPNAVVRNCLTYNNNNGFAILIQSGSGGGGVLSNLTVAETKVKGLYSKQQHQIPEVYNSVFWGKNADDENIFSQFTGVSGGGLKVSNSAVINDILESWTATDIISLNKEENSGNESGEFYPFFTSPATFDFTLAKGSALIGKGIVVENITPISDLFGNAYEEGKIDIGCFKYNGIDTGIAEGKSEFCDLGLVYASNNKLYVKNIEESTSLLIYDVSGKLISSLVITSDYECDLKSGLYIVKLQQENKESIKKIFSL